MKLMERLKVRGLYLVGLCLLSVFVLGVTGSASAANLLFVPHSGIYPYHFSGKGGGSTLETVGKSAITSSEVHVLGAVTSPTLGLIHLVFLGSKEKATTAPCGNVGAPSAGIILAGGLLFHFGLAHPGDIPAILILIHKEIEFTCEALGIKVPVKVKGQVIGEIISPALKAASLSLKVKFTQAAGKQNFNSFLLGEELLTSQVQKSKVGGGAEEESGQLGEAHLLASPGQGDFLLISP